MEPLQLECISENILTTDENGAPININIFGKLSEQRHHYRMQYLMPILIFDSKGRAFQSVTSDIICEDVKKHLSTYTLRYTFRYDATDKDNMNIDTDVYVDEVIIIMNRPKLHNIILSEMDYDEAIHLLKVREQLAELTKKEQELTRLYPRKPY